MIIDDLDKKLLALLSEDGRMSSAKLARVIGASERTVVNRVNKMINDGIISIVGMISSKHFGYEVIADILCEVETSRIDEIAKEIAEFPEVSYLAISFGSEDISVQVITKSTADLFEFIKTKLSQISGVIKTNTVIVPIVVKEFNEWIPPEVQEVKKQLEREFIIEPRENQ